MRACLVLWSVLCFLENLRPVCGLFYNYLRQMCVVVEQLISFVRTYLSDEVLMRDANRQGGRCL